MATDITASIPAPDFIESDAQKFYEIVQGRMVEQSPMGVLESVLASMLQQWMGPFARKGDLGRVVAETLFLIDRVRGLKRRPDLAFVSAARWPLKRRVPRTEAWDVVPDLAVEVVSQSNTADQVAEKIDEYFRADVRKLWVVYPVTNKVYSFDSPTSVQILQVGDDLDGGDVLPGFRFPLAVLFEPGIDEPES